MKTPTLWGLERFQVGEHIHSQEGNPTQLHGTGAPVHGTLLTCPVYLLCGCLSVSFPTAFYHKLVNRKELFP